MPYKKFLAILTFTSTLALGVSTYDAHAEKGWNHKKPASLSEAKERAKKHLKRLENMTENEWKAEKEKRQKRKEKWQNATDEQKAKWKAKKEAWQNMSHEEREALREKHRNRSTSKE
jgi:hypothetical protein